MPKLTIPTGATSNIVQLFVLDSRFNDGSGLIGLAYNNPTLAISYKRNTDASAVPVTLVNIPTLGNYTSGGFRSVTSMPGVYEFHPPNAAFASGARSVMFELTGPNAVPLTAEFQIGAIHTIEVWFPSPAPGHRRYLTVPAGGMISAWNMMVDAGTATVKVWKVARGSAIPDSSNSINTSGVGISTGTAIHSTNLADFLNLSVADGDLVGINVEAVATATQIYFALELV